MELYLSFHDATLDVGNIFRLIKYNVFCEITFIKEQLMSHLSTLGRVALAAPFDELVLAALPALMPPPPAVDLLRTIPPETKKS